MDSTSKMTGYRSAVYLSGRFAANASQDGFDRMSINLMMTVGIAGYHVPRKVDRILDNPESTPSRLQAAQTVAF